MNPLKWIVPLAVLSGAVVGTWYLIETKPDPEKRKRPPMKLAIDAMPLERTDFPILIRTRGTVRARTTSTIIPEISGRIVEISPSFRAGGFFKEGEILVRIDPSDYDTALVVSESLETEAEALLAQEKARAEQAYENWRKLRRGSEPSPLVLREPQLAEATGRIASAKAQVAKARRDLERTKIKAPYEGRIFEQFVDVGQYVTPGTTLATVYAVDFAEIRLPITSWQEGFINLPELYHNVDEDEADLPSPRVKLRYEFGGKSFEWEGKVVRTEGRVDTRSRQLYVVAQVEDPYAKGDEGAPPLKVGVFVEAELEGKVLEDVFVLPRKALRQDGEILLVDGGNSLRRHKIEILWDDEEMVVTRDELPLDHRLCLTSLPYAAEGAKVVIRGEPGSGPPADRRQAKKRPDRKKANET